VDIDTAYAIFSSSEYNSLEHDKALRQSILGFDISLFHHQPLAQRAALTAALDAATYRKSGSDGRGGDNIAISSM
jgi:hypothetical protein